MGDAKWNAFKTHFADGKVVAMLQIEDTRDKTKGGTEYDDGKVMSDAFDSDSRKLGKPPDADGFAEFKKKSMLVKVAGTLVDILKIGKRNRP